ncbi:hypothetical protein FNF29_02541 [Cafeteria roenbergensis]|uniref:Uncharacterized protein n=1 Tax=Cafeteria roenbergensis TaxID=33653 RepID=A0A5A8CR75_CAFRO|nr:hypothetical protein FNF29_02541 [Cafeteria roenbergensis]|eukprot:KAA0154321.1 hypothetical protein FNF29_02541 [Cafeteria roenbergensis]
MAALEARSLGFQTVQRSRQVEAYVRDAKSALESARSSIEAAAVGKEEIQSRLKRMEAAVADARSRLARSVAAHTAAPELVARAQAAVVGVFESGVGGVAKLLDPTKCGASDPGAASVYSLFEPSSSDGDLCTTWPPPDAETGAAVAAAGEPMAHEAATACVLQCLTRRTVAVAEHAEATRKDADEATAVLAKSLAQVVAAQGELRSAVSGARSARREAMQSQTELGPALATLDAARKRRDGALAALGRARADGSPFERRLVKGARALAPAGAAVATLIGAKEPVAKFQDAERILAAADGAASDAPAEGDGGTVADPLELAACISGAWDATCRCLEDKARWVCERALPQSVREVNDAATRLVRVREAAASAEQELASKAEAARHRLDDLASQCKAVPEIQALVERAAATIPSLQADAGALRDAASAIGEAAVAASNAIDEETRRLASEADRIGSASAGLRAEIADAEARLTDSQSRLRAAQLAAETAHATAREKKASQHQSLVRAASEMLRRTWAAAARARSHASGAAAVATRTPSPGAVNAVAGFAVASAAKELDDGRGAGPPGGEAESTAAERGAADGSLVLLARSPEQAADLAETARALSASVSALTSGEPGAPQPSNVADMLLHLLESLARGDAVPADVGQASSELCAAIDSVLAIPEATGAIRATHEAAAADARRAAERAAADCEGLVALLDGERRDSAGRAASGDGRITDPQSS